MYSTFCGIMIQIPLYYCICHITSVDILLNNWDCS